MIDGHPVPVYLFIIDFQMRVEIPFRWNAAKEINNSEKDVKSTNDRYLILTDGFVVKSVRNDWTQIEWLDVAHYSSWR